MSPQNDQNLRTLIFFTDCSKSFPENRDQFRSEVSFVVVSIVVTQLLAVTSLKNNT